MAKINWDSTLESTPDGTEGLSLGDNRIRELKENIRYRLTPTINFGTLDSGYTGDGRANPGSGRAFYGTATPTTLWKPDGSALTTSEMPSEATSASLGANDRGLLWVDESGAFPVLRYWDTIPTTDRFNGVAVPNEAINGGFQVWQRGTSFSVATATETYTTDRFYVNVVGATVTVSRATAFTGARSTYCLNMAGVAGWTSGYLGHRIEDLAFNRLKTGSASSTVSKITVSMFINNASTGITLNPTLDVNTANGGGGNNDFSAVTNQIVGQSLGSILNNSSARVSHTFEVDAYPANKGLEIQVNLGPSAAITAGDVQIAEFKVEVGGTQSYFVEEPIGQVTSACHRYFYRSSPNLTVRDGHSMAIADGVNNARTSVDFPTTMRATPTVSLYDQSTTTGQVRNTNGGGTVSSVAAADVTAMRFARITKATGWGTGDILTFHYDADAELT